ncbi:hypothetical protein Mal4_01780 [Maioricimonas rarisocia]|uniref:Uncharacterized protein n=1 Tax=Maioricimonas rarisocia TaxID=2528026 RepID=A0A517Z092_9PLAN|nr:hypothetical protein [Maioricimonas rarisocia]QDU35896.1 hypothetical protein Mal4_01780 [Maioricimonas rarisocia]
MTLFELVIGLSVLSAAVSGAVAGSSAGLFAAVAGLVAGGLVGFGSGVLPVLLLGGLVARFAPRDDGGGRTGHSAPPPSAEAQEVPSHVTGLLVLVLVPVLSAPVWIAYLSYRSVGWWFGTG